MCAPSAVIVALGRPQRDFLAARLSVSVVIAIVVILFLYQPVKVEGTSMTPALVNEERIFINKFVYRFGISDIVRGDTIVFWAPEDPSRSYIKRVIGVPGDVVEIVDGTVILNGKRLDEPYVTGRQPRSHVHDAAAWSKPGTISCWAITAVPRTTAAAGAPCRAMPFTARLCSCIGRWIAWACCANVLPSPDQPHHQAQHRAHHQARHHRKIEHAVLSAHARCRRAGVPA